MDRDSPGRGIKSVIGFFVLFSIFQISYKTMY